MNPLLTKKVESSSKPGPKCVLMSNESGTFRGVVAQKNISKGEVIVSEMPIVWVSPEDYVRFRGSRLWALTHVAMKNEGVRNMLKSQDYLLPGMVESGSYQKCFESPLWEANDDFTYKIMCIQHQALEPKLYYGLLYVYHLNFMCLNNVESTALVDWKTKLNTQLKEGMTEQQIEQYYGWESGAVQKTLNTNSKLPTMALGGGFYPKISFVNHSCEPNSHFLDQEGVPTLPPKGATKMLVASRKIKAGEEITFSYVSDEKIVVGLEERRKYLLDTFGFVCGCKKCNSQASNQKKLSTQGDVTP